MMNNPAHGHPPYGRKSRWLIVLFLAAVAASTILFLWFENAGVQVADRPFRGKMESEWVKNLKYQDDDQVKEWRGYGEEGVQVLIRGIEQADRPGERAYRKFYRRTSYWIVRWLPAPKDDSTRALRMTLYSVLESLGPSASNAVPIMARMLVQEENNSAKMNIINFFTYTEDQKCPLNQMPPDAKRALLPELLRAAASNPEEGVRLDALIALRFYPEERARIVPVLTNSIHDLHPESALMAVKALHSVAPDFVTNTDSIKIVADVLKNPDDQIAFRAAGLLGEMKMDPSQSVPALIDGTKSPSELVAVDSTQALLQFDQPTELILPALEAVLQRKDVSPFLKKILRDKMDAMKKTGNQFK